MKRNPSASSLLGASHLEMAALLNVGISHWSMYESGKRQLPTKAFLLLGEMLEHVRQCEAESAAVFKTESPPDKEQRDAIISLLRENEYQQLLLAKKIATAERKRLAQFRSIQLAGFIKLRIAANKMVTPEQQIFADGNRTTLDPKHSTVLFDLERRQAMLAFEQQWLEEKLLGDTK